VKAAESVGKSRCEAFVIAELRAKPEAKSVELEENNGKPAH